MSENTQATPETTPTDALAHEHLPLGKVAWVGIFSLILFAIGIWASKLELDHQRQVAAETHGVMALPSAADKPEQGIVNQQLFELEHRVKDQLKAQQEHLGSYGWVDRQKRIVHIPIDEAMKQVLAEQKR